MVRPNQTQFKLRTSKLPIRRRAAADSNLANWEAAQQLRLRLKPSQVVRPSFARRRYPLRCLVMENAAEPQALPGVQLPVLQKTANRLGGPGEFRTNPAEIWRRNRSTRSSANHSFAYFSTSKSGSRLGKRPGDEREALSETPQHQILIAGL